MTTILWNKAQITSVIKGVQAKQQDNNNSIQSVLLHSAMHATIHSDVSVFELLLDASKGVDRKAIMLWSREYAPVLFDKKGKATLNKGKQKEYRQVGITFENLADETAWFNMVPTVSDIAKSLDVLSRAESLIKSAESAEGEIKNSEFIQFLKDAVTKFKAHQTSDVLPDDETPYDNVKPSDIIKAVNANEKVKANAKVLRIKNNAVESALLVA